MAIATLHRTISITLLLLGIVFLVACGGGGGGGGDDKPAKDTTPEAFSFTASTNAASSAVVTSPAITVSGIDAPAAVSIIGGEYSINGGAFTASPGTVSSGQTIALKVTASSVTNTPVDAVVSVGGVRATFRVTTAPDVVPAEFNFSATTDAALGTAITSSPVTLSGFDVAVPISITNGEYSINGGAFTSAAGTISPTQTLAVKVISSSANSTAVDAILTVGGVSGTYRVTTLADAIPNAFAFIPAINAVPGSVNSSNAITVEGVDTTVPIVITGGEYSINGGAFTSAAGTVTNGQTVTVKAVALAGTELTHNAVVTIGSVSGTYSVTTILDTTAPVAEFKFPTPYTMSETNSVKVRGTATDDHAIASVKVVVSSFNFDTPENIISSEEIDVTPAAEIDGVKDFSSWTVEVPLTANAENEIKVLAMDEKNNGIELEDANKVVIRKADLSSAFPDEENEFSNIFQGLVIDRLEGRNRALIQNFNSVISVDLNTGLRQPLITHDRNISSLVLDPAGEFLFTSSYDEILEFHLGTGELNNTYTSELVVKPTAMVIDTTAKNGSSLIMVNSVYSDTSGGSSVGFSLLEKEFYLISPATNEPYLMLGEGIAVDSTNNRYLIPVGGQFDLSLHGIVAVDRDTGEHSIFSSNTVGGGELFGGVYGSDSALIIAIVDQYTNALIVPEYPNKLFSIDLTTGDRKVITNVIYRDTTGVGVSNAALGAMEIDEDKRILFAVESTRKALIAIDLETNEVVILSKSKNN
jgi:hypothetical protein